MKIMLQTSILGCPAKHIKTVYNMAFYEFNRTDVYAQIAVVIENEVKVIFDIKDETAKSGLSEINFEIKEPLCPKEFISEKIGLDVKVIENVKTNIEKSYTIEDSISGFDVEFIIIDENEIANIDTVNVEVNILG